MTTPLRIRGWEKWQSYRKDRGTPPWIKVHRVLFTNPEWAVLTDAEKGHLVSLWIAAADNGGHIPDNPRVLRKICMLDDEPDVNKFIHLGFIEQREKHGDAKVTPSCQPHDAPETETETEEKKNTSPGEGEVRDAVEESYKSRKGRLLKNGVLSSFNEFWEAFSYMKGKAEAADSWLDVYSPGVLDDIIAGAKSEAENRKQLIAKGGTPKWAQGWLTARRWEDARDPVGSLKVDCSRCDFWAKGICTEKKTSCNKFMEIRK